MSATGRVSVGHPVDVASGVQFTAAHDVEVEGDVILRFRRFYSTALLGDAPGALGRGWTHEYEARLQRDLDGYRFFGHDGATVCFDDPDDRVAAGGRIISLGDAMELRGAQGFAEVYHWHDAFTPVTVYRFARRGDDFELAAVVDPGGLGVTVARGGDGRVACVDAGAIGRAVWLDHDADGRLVALSLGYSADRARARVVARYEYDGRGMLAAVRDARGHAQRYAYDASGRLVEEVSRGGATWRMGYDARGRCVEAGADGGFGLRRFVYLDGVTEVTDGAGRTTLYVHNARGQVEREIAPDGATRETRFDAELRVVEEVDPLGAATKYAYDAAGNVAEVTWPGGASRRVAYDDHHQPTRVDDPGGAVWRFGYAAGALVHIEGPGGEAREIQRDARGELVSTRTPTGNLIAVRRDARRVECELTDTLGMFYRERRNEWWMPVTLEGPEGLVRRFEYDDDGLLVAEVDGDGRVTRFERDAEGYVCVVVEPDGATWRTERSPHGLCVRETDPLGRTHTYGYDDEGELTWVENPRGERATFGRDLRGRVVEAKHFDGRVERFGFDLAGRWTTHLRSDGVRVDRRYDDAGRLEAISCGDEVLRRFAYDEAGREVEAWSRDATVARRFDARGFVAEETCGGEVLRCTYDPCGGLASRDFTGSRCGPLRFEWDLRARLRSVSNPRGEGEVYLYDPSDALVERWCGRAVERRTFDREGRVVAQELAGVVARTFAYDDGGRLAGVDDSLRGPRRWRYDAAGQLATEQDGARQTTWRYDATGNIAAENGAPWHYAPGDALRATGEVVYAHDKAGRVATRRDAAGEARLEWDALDQLVAVHHPDGAVTRYGYDAYGRRVRKERGGALTEYFWSGDDLICERGDGRTIDYVQGDGETSFLWSDGALLHVLDGAGASRPHELVDDGGHLAWHGTLDAWGRLLASHGGYASQRLRLPGQQSDDESGLHYNRHRYYDPAAGRFVSPDPLRYAADFNLFAYAPDPINWQDPLGLVCGKGKGKYSVYVLEDNGNPRKILYIGITEQHPSARASQHRNGGPSTPPKTFDRMRVVANGLCYRQARDIEGSALRHVWNNPAAINNINTMTVGGQTRGDLLNSRRPATDGYYHSYNSPPGGNRTLRQAGTINNIFSNNISTH